ncbi:MAG: pilus assembly protein PilP [Gammaproteobacteria bacterium]
MLNAKTIGGRWLVIAALSTALAACGSGDRELQAYIDDVKARPGGQIEPLPEVTPPPSFAYEADNRRSPFVSDRRMQAAASANSVPGPDPNRPREFLEEVPLDTLTMVGTLSRSRGSSFGLVRDSEGRVHRVTVGNYVGQNYGRITAITDSEIRLVELIPDTLGAYIERPAGIGLSD